MADSLVGRSCADFADALAAKLPVPGGGGAAALVGALAAALCSMAGEFTVGKPRYADVDQDVRNVLAQAADHRARLLALVEQDAAGFEPLAAAWAIPRDDPSRRVAVEQATRDACDAPLAIMRETAQVICLLEEMRAKGTRLMQADVGCGALLAEAALRSAAVSVLVNTRSYRERQWARDAEAEANGLLGAYLARAEAVGCSVEADLRKGA